MIGLPWKLLDKPKISRETRKIFLQAACRDFKVFAKLCGPPGIWVFGVEHSVHDKIADTVTSEKRSPDGKIRQHIEAPRTGGKSALAGQRHAAWRLARSAVNYAKEPYKDGSISMVYMGENEKRAKEAGVYVHGILSGRNNVTRIFGKLVDPKSSIKEFTLLGRKMPKPQPSWFIGTPSTSTTGTHPDLIYVDDVETPKSTRNIDAMLKTRAWFDELQAQLNPRGEIRVMGTRYDENDLYGYILDQAEGLWEVLIATVENSYCPTLPPEVLAGLKLTMSPGDYAARYLNDPWTSALQTFKKEMFHIRHYNADIAKLPTYMLVDFAGSEAREACETAIWIVAKDPLDNVFCIDLIHGRWKPSVVMEKMASLWIKRNPRWWVVEKRVLTTWVKPLVEKANEQFRISMTVREASLKGYVDKDHHIKGLQPRFASNKIFFCDTISPIEMTQRQIGSKIIIEGPLVNAFVRWPRAKLKDVADALAYLDGLDDDDSPLVPKPRRWEETRMESVDESGSKWKMY